jgi:predicted XRE-type DNA-binding protein
MMNSNEDFELIHGSGNVFRDFGHPDADIEQAKSILAARIIGILDDEGLSTRKAQEKSGTDHADFARIRNVKLDRFTIDRLMTIINRLGHEVDIRIDVRRRKTKPATARPERPPRRKASAR